MATNYVQEGEVLALVAPYTRTAGQGAKVGSIFGVALVDVTSAATASFATEGTWDLTKAGSQAWATIGLPIYWDDSAKACTTTDSGNTLIGVNVATVAGGAGDTTGRVRLNGVF
jgi:predicted RecA/RadA family phage recombinase